jgi:hypothetical protein
VRQVGTACRYQAALTGGFNRLLGGVFAGTKTAINLLPKRFVFGSGHST